MLLAPGIPSVWPRSKQKSRLDDKSKDGFTESPCTRFPRPSLTRRNWGEWGSQLLIFMSVEEGCLLLFPIISQKVF